MEEIASPADASYDPAPDASAPLAAREPVRAYDPAVLTDRQPRITDLVPVRPLALTMALLACVAGLALVVGLHVATQQLRRGPLVQVLAPLDLTQRASLAHWLAAVWLAAAGGLAILIYRMRLHRADDYQGRYRVWLWVAGLLGWLSLDAIASLHMPLGWLLARIGGRGPAPTETSLRLAWMSLYSLVFGAVGLWLAGELRPSKASLATLTLAAAMYLAAAGFELGWLSSGDQQRDALLIPLMPLVAHGLLLWTVLWYARHVYLDAAGRLLVQIEADRPSARKRKRVGWWGRVFRLRPRSAEAAGVSPASDAPPAAGDMALRKRPLVARPAPAADPPHGAGHGVAPADDAAPAAGEPLSRAERRRLKRLARADEQRRAA